MHILDAERQRRNLISKSRELEAVLERRGGIPALIHAQLTQVYADFDEVESYIDSLQQAKPCSHKAVMAGCLCYTPYVHRDDIDPPEPIRHRACPLHGPNHGE